MKNCRVQRLDLLKKGHEILEKGTGIAGEITCIGTTNKQLNSLYFEDADAVPLALPVCASILFGLTAGVLSGAAKGLIAGAITAGITGGAGLVPIAVVFALYGFGFGIANIASDAWRNRSRLFQPYDKPSEFAYGVLTTCTSPVASVLLALEQCVLFLAYLAKGLGNFITWNWTDTEKNIVLSGDAFIKIFSNLAAAILNPFINGIGCIGSLIASAGVPEESTEPLVMSV